VTNTSHCLLEVKVAPRSSRSDVRYENGVIKVRVIEAPVDGRATEAARQALAKALGLKRGQVVLTSGATARHKRFRIEGLTELEALARLGR